MIRNLKALGLALVAVLAMSAMAASAAQANDPAHFGVGAEGPVSLSSEATSEFQVFVTSTGKITCANTGGEGSTEGVTTEITMENFSFTGCHATALKLPITIDTNGCDFIFTAGTYTTGPEDADGSVKIANCDSATGITVTIYTNSNHLEENRGCTIDVPEQEVGGITYTNKVNNGVEYVQVDANVVNEIHATFTKGPKNLCVDGHTEEEGDYEGSVAISGSDQEEEATNVTVTPTP
jgi:hypothetical protein